MPCHYHEADEAVRACAGCGKQLCEQCFNADYPEYCWSCGLEHSNDIVERDKAIRRPAWLSGPTGTYVIAKLAAAGGTYIAVSLIIAVIFGALDLDVLIVAGVLAAFFSTGVIYAYGIAYSMLVDGMMRISGLKPGILEAVLYLVGGMIFPLLIEMDVHLGIKIYDPSGIVSALIFYGMNRWFMKRRHHTSTLAVASTTLVPAMIIMLLHVVGYIQK